MYATKAEFYPTKTLQRAARKKNFWGGGHRPKWERGLSSALMGYFPDSAHRCGGRLLRPPPPAICQTNGPIPDPKTAFDRSGFELSEYVATFCLNGTDEVTGRVKCQTDMDICHLDICHFSLHQAKQPYQIELKPMERQV